MSLFQIIVNCETGEVSEVPLTAKQIKDRNDYAKKQLIEIEAKETQRQEILDRLGLTADEAKLILG